MGLAAAMVVLLAVDTFFTGLLLVTVRRQREVLSEHAEVINDLVSLAQLHEHEIVSNRRDSVLGRSRLDTVRDDG